MNEETKKAMEALAGGAQGVNPSGDATDWKARFEEMERKYQSAMVEQGRVRKLDEEKKALERQLDELQASRRAADAISALPDDLKADLPEDFQRGSSLIAQRTVENALRERDAEMAELRAQIAATKKTDFASRIESEFPGFLASAVNDGGDKHAAWTAYQRYNSASINAAVQSCDFDTLAWHIRTFYSSELGIAPPSGGPAPAAADPSTIGGGTPVASHPGKIYTAQEISALYDEVERARDRGDMSEVKRIGNEIDRAMREGRVK